MTKRLKLMKDGVKTNENYFKNPQKKKKALFSISQLSFMAAKRSCD